MSTAAAIVYVSGFLHAKRRGGSPVGLGRARLVLGSGLHLAQVAGSALLTIGMTAGLYIAAFAMVAVLAFMISGAWLLIVGVNNSETGHSAAPFRS